MKSEVKVSVVQFSAEWLNVEKNVKRMKEFIVQEANNGSELIVFPELATTGYVTPAVAGEKVDFENLSYSDALLKYVRASETVPGPTTNEISILTKKYNVYVVFGISQLHPTVHGTIYNSAVLVGPNGIIGVHHKMHLPLNEKLYFYPGNTLEVFETPIGNIGLAVCYDGRFPEYSRILALNGAEIICNIWNIMDGLGKVTPDPKSIHYRAYTRAQENGVYHVNSNRSGTHGKYIFTGHSVIAAPNGTLIAKSETNKEEVIRATLYEEDLIRYRSSLTIFQDRRPELYGPIIKPLSETFEQSNEQTFLKVEEEIEKY